MYKRQEDHSAPTFANCPVKPILLPCNSPRPLAENALAVLGAVTDNCPGQIDIQVTGGVPTQTTGCNWTSIFTIKATDACGNVSVCTITYNWSEDVTAPEFAHCPSGPVDLSCNAPHPTVADEISAAGVVTDNCPGTVSVSYTHLTLPTKRIV